MVRADEVDPHLRIGYLARVVVEVRALSEILYACLHAALTRRNMASHRKESGRVRSQCVRAFGGRAWEEGLSGDISPKDGRSSSAQAVRAAEIEPSSFVVRKCVGAWWSCIQN